MTTEGIVIVIFAALLISNIAWMHMASKWRSLYFQAKAEAEARGWKPVRGGTP